MLSVGDVDTVFGMLVKLDSYSPCCTTHSNIAVLAVISAIRNNISVCAVRNKIAVALSVDRTKFIVPVVVQFYVRTSWRDGKAQRSEHRVVFRNTADRTIIDYNAIVSERIATRDSECSATTDNKLFAAAKSGICGHRIVVD